MANASGEAADGLLPGEFTHRASGVSYRLYVRDGQAWLSYSRGDMSVDRSLQGEQELMYYIGSGVRGRTYLFQRDGFWFESPVNWYSKKQIWDMNPKSLQVKEMPFTLPVDSTCLHCHTSGAQPSLPGSRNHFDALPFRHTGITCEGCHGDPTAHLAQNGHGAIVNPANLSGSRKVSVCLQCHLEGEIAVNQLGRTLGMFEPGDDLSEDVRFFVHEGEVGAMGRATSQWEALQQSACFRRSGGQLTCTTCHDPHTAVAPSERVSYYRARCTSCHGESAFLASHHPEQADCTSCHMARERTENVAHEQVTDHFIQKRPLAGQSLKTPDAETLTAVGGEPVSVRELGLAYAQMASSDPSAVAEARRLLGEAERKEFEAGTSITDADLHMELGSLDLAGGDMSAAAAEYQVALTGDPQNSVAAGNLAVLQARAHHLNEAVRLWQSVAANDPGEPAAGFNLAVAACMLGDRSGASRALERVLAFSPDDAKAKRLLAQLRSEARSCGSEPH